ncbi:MAG: hypothetical protein ACK5RQ_04885 [Bacteroidota bacterium]
MRFTGDDLQQRWWKLEAELTERFGKKPDLETILFLIGIQETGFIRESISKEQKQDLMHVAMCRILKSSGFYQEDGKDDDGWPHFTQLKELPALSLPEQENFIRDHILLYFEQMS